MRRESIKPSEFRKEVETVISAFFSLGCDPIDSLELIRELCRQPEAKAFAFSFNHVYGERRTETIHGTDKENARFLAEKKPYVGNVISIHQV